MGSFVLLDEGKVGVDGWSQVGSLYRSVSAALLATVMSPLLVSSAHADHHGTGPGEGELTLTNVTIGSCVATSVTIRYRLGSLLGSPTITAVYAWEGDADCRLPASTVVLLEVRAAPFSSDASGGWVRVSPIAPRANDGFGHDVTGARDLDEVLCTYEGTESIGCLGEDAAREVWRTGRVVGARFAF